jgi:hypothetical protein
LSKLGGENKGSMAILVINKEPTYLNALSMREKRILARRGHGTSKHGLVFTSIR